MCIYRMIQITRHVCTFSDLMMVYNNNIYSETCLIWTVNGLRKTVLNREVSLLGRLTTDHEI